MYVAELFSELDTIPFAIRFYQSEASEVKLFE